MSDQPTDSAAAPRPSPALKCLFFLCLIALVIVPIKSPLSIFDEGIAVFSATRIMSGETPCTSFWTTYPPGQFYALAAMFKTFGVNLLTARIYDTFVRFVVVIIVYLIAVNLTSVTTGMVVSAITAIALGSIYYCYAVVPALAICLLAILLCITRALEGSLSWLLLIGCLLGLASFIRWDIGLYGLFSIGLSTFLVDMFTMDGEWRGRVLTACKKELALCSGFLATVALVYGFLGSAAGFQTIWDQLVLFPATTLQEVRRLTLPPLIPRLVPEIGRDSAPFFHLGVANWLRFYLPLVSYALGIACLVGILVRRQNVEREKLFGALACIAFGSFLFLQAASRYDYVHVLPTDIVMCLVIGQVFHLCGPERSKGAKFAWGSLLIVLAIVCLHAPVTSLMEIGRTFSPFGCYSRLERAGCVFIQEDQQRAVEYVVSRTHPAEPVFVGNRRHDRLVINDVGFYFLMDRPCPTAYSELCPGVATTASVQKTIVADLRKRNVKWVVLADAPMSTEPNASSVGSGVTILDEFIRANYAEVITIGSYQIRSRSADFTGEP